MKLVKSCDPFLLIEEPIKSQFVAGGLVAFDLSYRLYAYRVAGGCWGPANSAPTKMRQQNFRTIGSPDLWSHHPRTVTASRL